MVKHIINAVSNTKNLFFITKRIVSNFGHKVTKKNPYLQISDDFLPNFFTVFIFFSPFCLFLYSHPIVYPIAFSYSTFVQYSLSNLHGPSRLSKPSSQLIDEAISCISGVSVVYVWCICSVCLVYVWCICSVCLVYVWCICSVCLVYVWCISSVCVVYL